jgi:glycine reductase
MRLELANFPVKDVRFGQHTIYSDGVLEINKEEFIKLILKDKRITSADLDVASPGEQTRIGLIRDVVEPRVKVSGPGCVFPGILGPVETVGEGRTNRLSGITVMPTAEYNLTVTSGTGAASAGLVDMWGPGALMTPFGSTVNIVLILELAGDVTEVGAHAAIQLAELRVGNQLAKTTKHLPPEDVEVFELFEVDASLPRVVYIPGCLTIWEDPHSAVAYYGLPIQESLPTFIHPNELFDGALTTDARKGWGNHPMTWDWMNNPVVIKLFKEHGKRLNFLGVILQRTRFESELGKQVAANCASQIARLLRADGAILTRMSPSGNNLVDVMLTAQACERKGVKTVFITLEYGGRDGTELPLVFYVPEATSMVSTGSLEREIKLPAPAKVIGCKDKKLVIFQPGDPPLEIRGEITLRSRLQMTGGLDWLGGMNLTCNDY